MCVLCRGLLCGSNRRDLERGALKMIQVSYVFCTIYINLFHLCLCWRGTQRPLCMCREVREQFGEWILTYHVGLWDQTGCSTWWQVPLQAQVSNLLFILVCKLNHLLSEIHMGHPRPVGWPGSLPHASSCLLSSVWCSLACHCFPSHGAKRRTFEVSIQNLKWVRLEAEPILCANCSVPLGLYYSRSSDTKQHIFQAGE